MGKRRLRVSTSEDEEDPSPAAEKKRPRRGGDEEREKEKRKEPKRSARGRGDEEEDEEEDEEDEEEEEEAVVEDAKPVGEVAKVTGKGKKRKEHYASFEYDGNVFELEDPVLLTPEDKGQKPYVAIIKDITQDVHGSVMVTGQWFYRPEEAEKKGGGSWESHDTRELFYSFHLDDVPAESVMHKCIVHFVPLNKQLPVRSQHPGFFVQRVYDTVERKLWKLTDKDYEDNKQHEIDILVQKTRERLGELPDIVEDTPATTDRDDQSKSKWNLRRKNMPSIDVAKDDAAMRPDNNLKAETPGSCTTDASEYHAILVKFKALTGDSVRDRWLEKLLQGIQLVCDLKVDAMAEDKKMDHASLNAESAGSESVTNDMEPKDKSSNDCKDICWPDAAISAITALEKVTYEALGSEYSKYNKKMRQLDFNLKNNATLARRLLNKELDPEIIFNMSPNELKDGLTAEEKAAKEPEKPRQLQMTDARCSRCTEKKVGVADIIHAGGHGDRYQLECIACGHTWYAPRDAVSSLTIDEPTVVGNVGTAPWATAKFEEVEKKLVSPREPDKEAIDLFKKSTEPYMPVLEKQKSFNRTKTEDPSAAAAAAARE